MLANVITSCRIILSVTILLFPAFSTLFYSLYLTAGFTDMIDGAVARKQGTNSELGAKLDTVADIVFVAAASYKLLPLTINIVNISYSSIAVCLIATFAAVQECHIIRREELYYTKENKA